ncbi:hypothetical protein E5D57_007579 [Metarhizium anisopliae]|nr:hypothetical protein E5D57_007579 [Metarhizium anisopliae]
MAHATLYHSSLYYAHISQTAKGLGPGDLGQFLVIAATRDDMKRFFRGLQKYTKISNTTITEVTPVQLAWWNFKSVQHFDLLEIIKNIYQMDTSYYGNMEELNESDGMIQVTGLTDRVKAKDCRYFLSRMFLFVIFICTTSSQYIVLLYMCSLL